MQTSGNMAGRKTCYSSLAELASWLMMYVLTVAGVPGTLVP